MSTPDWEAIESAYRAGLLPTPGGCPQVIIFIKILKNVALWWS